jgi:hypothetical protein
MSILSNRCRYYFPRSPSTTTLQNFDSSIYTITLGAETIQAQFESYLSLLSGVEIAIVCMIEMEELRVTEIGR